MGKRIGPDVLCSNLSAGIRSHMLFIQAGKHICDMIWLTHFPRNFANIFNVEGMVMSVRLHHTQMTKFTRCVRFVHPWTRHLSHPIAIFARIFCMMKFDISLWLIIIPRDVRLNSTGIKLLIIVIRLRLAVDAPVTMLPTCSLCNVVRRYGRVFARVGHWSNLRKYCRTVQSGDSLINTHIVTDVYRT